MSTVPQMTCREFVEICTDYLEGALPSAEEARLHRHLALCPFCGEYLEQLRLTLQLTGALRESDVSAEMRAELVTVFTRWRDEA